MGEVFALSKIRLKFSKMGMGKYISHLDLLRTFTRAIQRSGLPVRYSQGFNPHQLITFSLPLALGTTSETEFVDIDFEDGTDRGLIIEALNRCLPPDIKILSASEPLIKAKDIVSAGYTVKLGLCEKVESSKIKDFFAQDNIPAIKKTKRGEKEVNLKEFIFGWEEVSLCDNCVILNVLLSAGGENNIKPDIFVLKLREFLGSSVNEAFDIHRTGIFCSQDGTIKFS